MQFQHPLTLDQLEQVFRDAVAKATKLKDWYENPRHFWRFMSYLSRGAVFLGIVVGTVLPLVSLEAPKVFGVPFESSVQLGMAFLVVAGLLYALDQVFMISLTWERYRDAQTKIESLLLECEYDWIRMKASIPDDATANEKRDEALALFDKLVMDARRVVEEETDVWATQFAASRSFLEKLLTKRTEAMQQKVDEEKEANEERRKAREVPKVNGVKVSIKNHDKLTGEITVTLGGLTQKRDPATNVVVFQSVPFGKYKVDLSGALSAGGSVAMEDLVEVKAGAPAAATFTVA